MKGATPMDMPHYIKWFVNERSTCLEDGVPISCYKLDYTIDNALFDEWALHIRRHYESDNELKESIAIMKMSAEEYLKTYVIPQKSDPFGPTARSNDFTEIMISDLIEFVNGYTVSCCKQDNRSGKTNSEHGTDILAYKFANLNRTPNAKDELLAIEVKAGLTSDNYEPINKAVTDSQKYDDVRYAHTLNFYRKSLRYKQQYQQADEISRFQKKSEHDFILTFIAAAVISREDIPTNTIIGIRGKNLALRNNDKIFLVHGKKLMTLAHQIYERCIK